MAERRAAAGLRRRAHDTLAGRAGRLGYYVGGDGPPLLLVHSINAAGSAYEVKPIFEHVIGRPARLCRRPAGLRLLGPLASATTSRRCTWPRSTTCWTPSPPMAAPEPIDALAVSLGSEFLARAAAERPERFRTLTLVTPTGLQPGLRDSCTDRSRAPARCRASTGSSRFRCGARPSTTSS